MLLAVSTFFLTSCNKEYHHDVIFEVNANGFEILRIDTIPFTYEHRIFFAHNRLDTVVVDTTVIVNGIKIKIDTIVFNRMEIISGDTLYTPRFAVWSIDTTYLKTIYRARAIYLFRQFDFKDNPQRIDYDFENSVQYFLETDLLKTKDGKDAYWWRREISNQNKITTRSFYGDYYVIARIFDGETSSDREDSWLSEIRQISIDKSTRKRTIRFNFSETDARNVFLEK